MKAIADMNQETVLTELERQIPTGHELEIKVIFAGINRRDLLIRSRRGHEYHPVTLGSDAVGIVTKVGKDVTRFITGDHVIVNPGLHWHDITVSSPDTLEIVGYPNHGTFSEFYINDEAYFEHKPKHLSDMEAGCLALSALTAYRAVFTKANLSKGETIFIPGGSSGVSTYMVQFAKMIGARVITTSREQEKLSVLADLGADRTLLTSDDWPTILKSETIDCVIDSIGGETFNRSLEVLKKGGRLVTFGATTDDVVSFNVRQFFYNQQTILGSTMGSRKELRLMLQFIEKHSVHPVVDRSFYPEQYLAAFDYVKQSRQLGKVVFQFN